MPQEVVIYKCNLCLCGYGTYEEAERCEQKKTDCDTIFEKGELIPKVNISNMLLNGDNTSKLFTVDGADKVACLTEVIEWKLISNIDTHKHSVLYHVKIVAPEALQAEEFLISEFGLGTYIALDIPTTNPAEVQRFFEHLMYMS